MPHVDTLTSTQSYTIPAGVSSIQIECVGGGGNGAAASVNGGGGGGGAAYSKTNAQAVTPGDVWTATIGAAGGGDTSFVKGGTTACLAKGGGNGAAGAAGGQGAGGAAGLATGCTGDVKNNGGVGGGSGGTNVGGGGGGGGGGSSGAGSAGGATGGGGPGNSGSGSGGAGAGVGVSTAGQTPGGGGGGASTSHAASNGGPGQITLTYTQGLTQSGSCNAVASASASRKVVAARSFSANAVASASASRLLALARSFSANASVSASFVRAAAHRVSASANAVASAVAYVFKFFKSRRFTDFAPPSAVLDALLGPATNIRRRVDICEMDGTTLWRYDAPTIDGTVSVDASRQERRTLDITFDNRDGSLRHSPLGLWYDKVIKPYRGITLVDGSYWEVPLGEFMIDSIDSESFPHTIQVKGRDRAKLLIVDEFTQTTTFTADQTLNAVVHTIAINAGVTRFAFASTGGPVLGSDITFDRETTRAKALDDLTTAQGYEWYFDATGLMILRPFLDPLTSPAQFTFKTGAGGSLAHYKKSTADTQLKNSILVYNSRTDVIPAWAVARNTVVSSPTNIAKIGERVFSYKSALLDTTDACQTLANTFLHTMSLDEYTVELSGIVLPWLDAGNIVEFDDPDPDPDQPLRFLLHDFTIPLSLSEMVLNAKRVVIAVYGTNMITPTQNTNPPPYAATSCYTDVAWATQTTNPYSHQWVFTPEFEAVDWVAWMYQAKLVSASGVWKAGLQAGGADPGGGAARKVAVFSMPSADTTSATLGPTFASGVSGLVTNTGGTRTITVDFDWVAGHQYQLRVAKDGDDGSGHPGWAFWVTDMTTATMTLVGHMYVSSSLGNIDSTQISTASTTRFGPSTPASCASINYAGALFTDFSAGGGLLPTGLTSRFDTTVVCTNSAISTVPGGVRHEIGTS